MEEKDVFVLVFVFARKRAYLALFLPPSTNTCTSTFSTFVYTFALRQGAPGAISTPSSGSKSE
jgi:hypothetical protein